MALQREAGAAASAQACSGNLAVAVRQTAQRRSLSFLDATTGEPRDVDVEWRSSHQLALERERSRPCGYLIGASEKVAVQRLRALGVEVSDLATTVPQTSWTVEDYLVDSEAAGQRQDARGAIADNQTAIRLLRVQTLAGQVTPAPGSYYVSMSQPLAALVSAALEPDSQNSFAANRLMAFEEGRLRRVMRAPPDAALASPSAR